MCNVGIPGIVVASGLKGTQSEKNGSLDLTPFFDLLAAIKE